MGASMLTGESWKALTTTVPGHRSLPLERIIYSGVRDLSEGQMRKLKASPARVVDGRSLDCTIDYVKALEEHLEKTTASTYILYIDLDSLDTLVGKANEYAAPGEPGDSSQTNC